MEAGSRLVALARSRGIRTCGKFHCKFLLSPFTFLNYTKKTRYEALEKNAFSKQKMPQLGNLKYSRHSRKAPFIGRFSAYSSTEKYGR
jgi:hypothetical protein